MPVKKKPQNQQKTPTKKTQTKKTSHKNLRTVLGLFSACTVANFLFFLLIVNFCVQTKQWNDALHILTSPLIFWFLNLVGTKD